MVLKRLFKEPTRITLFAASLLALFEAINSAGYSDNIAISVGLIDSTPIAGEKITSPGGVNLDVWGATESWNFRLRNYSLSFICYSKSMGT